MNQVSEKILELLTKASTLLPDDVAAALEAAGRQEAEGGIGKSAMGTIIENVRLAKERVLPMCQDTGMIHFFVTAPPSFSRKAFRAAAEEAVVEATRRGLLRQNCVESVSGKNTGNNLGYVSPVFHWEESEDDECRTAEITVLLKGGGSENMGIQYSLPDAELGAGRDLNGVRKCILDAVFRAQGKGCSPGILGVAIGGDRAGGCEEAKLQLLRRIGERSAVPELAELETRCLKEANSLGIGPSGLGGKTAVLDVFIGSRTRHPASFFVTVCYNCWCVRRQSMTLAF